MFVVSIWVCYCILTSWAERVWRKIRKYLSLSLALNVLWVKYLCAIGKITTEKLDIFHFKNYYWEKIPPTVTPKAPPSKIRNWTIYERVRFGQLVKQKHIAIWSPMRTIVFLHFRFKYDHSVPLFGPTDGFSISVCNEVPTNLVYFALFTISDMVDSISVIMKLSLDNLFLKIVTKSRSFVIFSFSRWEVCFNSLNNNHRSRDLLRWLRKQRLKTLAVHE